MRNDGFMVGVNYPWRYYGQDFGTCGWGYRGLAGAVDELQRDFRGIRTRFPHSPKPVVRVFIFADGRASPHFDSTGEVVGLDDSFFRDFDALLETARQSDLLVMPVLLDFRWCAPRAVVNGVPLGGHSDVITEPNSRARFLDRVLAPLLGRYGKAPEIYAWDLINEPEWTLRTARSWLRFRVEEGLASYREFVRGCAVLIHEQTAQLVTLGSARPQWVRYWHGLGLDLYQCHWHLPAWRLRVGALRVRIRTLDRPCLVGEAPTARSGTTPSEYVAKARREGYCGILFWSFRAQDRASDFSKV